VIWSHADVPLETLIDQGSDAVIVEIPDIETNAWAMYSKDEKQDKALDAFQ
jgi:hypothetical protein